MRGLSRSLGPSPPDLAVIPVRRACTARFPAVLIAVHWSPERLARAPRGRTMRAMRDDGEAARAMGKDVDRRHLQAFVPGSAIVGIGGAMLVTPDGLTAGTGRPLRHAFLIWPMVIIGGSGHHGGAIFGAFLIWFPRVEAETAGLWLAQAASHAMPAGNPLRMALEDGPAQLRYIVMGLILVSVMRLAPRGLIPEATGKELR